MKEKFFNGEQKSYLDFSGGYTNQKAEGSPLNSWWKGATNELGSSQNSWKENYEKNPIQKELQEKYLKNDETN